MCIPPQIYNCRLVLWETLARKSTSVSRVFPQDMWEHNKVSNIQPKSQLLIKASLTRNIIASELVVACFLLCLLWNVILQGRFNWKVSHKPRRTGLQNLASTLCLSLIVSFLFATPSPIPMVYAVHFSVSPAVLFSAPPPCGVLCLPLFVFPSSAVHFSISIPIL